MNNFKSILTIIFIFYCAASYAQNLKILHYTETSGYDHQTRGVSYSMIQQLGIQYGFNVDDDSTGDSFNSLSGLLQYDVVVFSNTTGDAILNGVQKLNFENYISAGGSLLGIHSATDTYRHSTANGTNTCTWDWFAETLGGSVQQNPNHVTGTPLYRIDAVNIHPSIVNVPNPWFKQEEYYYWESGYQNPANTIVQMVEQTIGPNSMVNSYDSSRAVTWYRALSGGGTVFYTSLGHAADNFFADTSFRNLIRDALLSMLGITSSFQEINNSVVNGYSFNNLCSKSENLKIYIKNGKKAEIVLYDISGKPAYRTQGTELIIIPAEKINVSGNLLLIKCTAGLEKFIGKIILY